MADYEDTKVKDLIINNMSQEKFNELKDAGELDPTQIYCTPEDGGASGDYLPLSGGTLTGSLKINPEVSDTFGDVLVLSYGDNDVTIKKSRYNNYLLLNGTKLAVAGLIPSTVSSMPAEIGAAASQFSVVYTKQLSGSTSSSDVHYLLVPDKDGTIATVEDINAAVGDISTALTAILGE